MTARVEMTVTVSCDHGWPSASSEALRTGEATQSPCMNKLTFRVVRDDAVGEVRALDHEDMNEMLALKGWADLEIDDTDAAFIVCPQHKGCPIVATFDGVTETGYAPISEIFSGNEWWGCPCPVIPPHLPGQGALDVEVAA